MGKGPIPDKWAEYTPIGRQIKGTRFIAFKVPLSSDICNRVEEVATRLDIMKVLRVIPNLGLVVDLTNTHRYYNPQEFISNGVQHVKLMVPGHETPTKELRRQFSTVVQQFLNSSKNKDKLIGVHCTHGVNRTGFFICDHMVTELGMNPSQAIEMFGKARGHSIERQNYLSELYVSSVLNKGNEQKLNPSVKDYDADDGWTVVKSRRASHNKEKVYQKECWRRREDDDDEFERKLARAQRKEDVPSWRNLSYRPSTSTNFQTVQSQSYSRTNFTKDNTVRTAEIDNRCGIGSKNSYDSKEFGKDNFQRKRELQNQSGSEVKRFKPEMRGSTASNNYRAISNCKNEGTTSYHSDNNYRRKKKSSADPRS